jgi:hypothetical protein
MPADRLSTTFAALADPRAAPSWRGLRLGDTSVTELPSPST